MKLHHDAFISYSHAADGALAPAVEAGLEHLAKPLLKLRAINVFRDQTSLSASPALWKGIADHLKAAKWLLLFASPAAAASPWCQKEIEWWLENRGSQHLLILLTEGEIAWGEDGGGMDTQRTTALPAFMARYITDEPLYVDLRWAREAKNLNLRDVRFRDAIVSVPPRFAAWSATNWTVLTSASWRATDCSCVAAWPLSRWPPCSHSGRPR